MRKPLVLLAVVLVLGLIPLSLAASWIEQDEWTATLDLAGADGTLTITPGASGTWVSGGYAFNGTAYATRTNFKPLHNQGAFTVSLWFSTKSVASGVRYLVSQYVGANTQVAVWQSNVNFRLSIGTGSTLASVNFTNLVAGKVYYAVATWDKSLNGGKLSLWVNGTYSESSRVMTSNTTADDKLYLGAGDGSFNWADNTIYSLAFYNYKFSESMMNATKTGRDVFFENASYYWTFNEGTSTVANPALPAFMIQDVWAETLPTGEPWVPEWYSQEAWYGFLYLPSVPAEYGPMVNVWLGFMGLVMIPGGAAVFAKSKNYKLALLMIACGFALLIGTVV